MNILNFSNTGGFPFDTNTLDFMQDSYNLLNAIGEIAGNLTILKGCVVAGTSVSDGVVFINGEVLAFKGGAGSKVIIKEDVTQLPFEDGSSKDVERVRYATFGLASTSFLWSDFTRAQRAIVPRGLISMWSGAIDSLPQGWTLCDGNNGTPDLSGRFVVGYDTSITDYNSIGKTGGVKEVVLTKAEMPSHKHAGSITIPPHEHNIPADGGSSFSNGSSVRRESGLNGAVKTNKNSSQDINYTTGLKGESAAHENRPPYFTLAYIIFKG
jgi:microcystin-dependent protein